MVTIWVNVENDKRDHIYNFFFKLEKGNKYLVDICSYCRSEHNAMVI